MRRITSLTRRCIDDYDMIADGSKIAVGVSGGKDSLILLCALAELQRYHTKHFQLHAIAVDLGFTCMDYTPLRELCARLKVKFTRVSTDISQVVFEAREETNPCSLCAKMRKGALMGTAAELGCTRVALGHHFDDAINTFMMSMIFEGRLNCFSPVTYLDRSGVYQIRPLLYIEERVIAATAKKLNLPVIKNPCPMDSTSKRSEIKELVTNMEKKYPGFKARLFGAMRRLPLNGWAPNGLSL